MFAGRSSSHVTALGVLASLSSVLLFTSPAAAIQVDWGNLPVTSGPNIYDWEVQSWIDAYFADGSPNNEVVDTNIAMYYTQCLGGDWLENFNTVTNEPAGGSFYDSVRFTNASVHAANGIGLSSFYSGYHYHSAEAVAPFHNTTWDDSIEQIPGVHERGIRGKDSRESPLAQGPNNRLYGNAATEILIYAGKPEPLDFHDINTIVNSYAGFPVGMTVLAGNGTGSNVDGAATRTNLRNALQSIGPRMSDPLSQFLFFVTDHGGLTQKNVDHVLIAEQDTAHLPLTYNSGIFELLENDRYNQARLNLATAQAIADPRQVVVSLDGPSGIPFEFSLGDRGVLATSVERRSEEGEPQTLTNYAVGIPDELLAPPFGRSAYELTLNVTNAGVPRNVTFEEWGIDTGSLEKGVGDESLYVDLGVLPQGTLAAAHELNEETVLFYRFELEEQVAAADGSFLVIDTLGSQLTDAGFGPNDTEIGVYDTDGLLFAVNDDHAPGRESLLAFGDHPEDPGDDLAAGIYYLAVGGFNTTFAATNFDVSSASPATGIVQVNFLLQYPLNADFDKDGDVDGEDFLIWQVNFPTLDGTATSNTGDTNADGNVDGEDFLAWQQQFGSGVGGDGQASVPEFTAAVLATIAMAVLSLRRHRC